ncbi:MAG: FecR domain-containing protein [Planctomycetota bacterium]|jgi:hypothetical protein
MGWRVAAAAAIFLALVGLHLNTNLFSIEAGGLIRIEHIEGEVFQVTDDGNVPLSEGDEVVFTDVTGIRTAKGSSAMFRLSDDSVVEMNERAELAVKNRKPFWSPGDGDAVIDLARGNIIVEASQQGSGHFYVDTSDVQVAVTGTVFAVNHGIKGSRISVIEGEVEVSQGRESRTLHPGQQATSGGVAKIPVEQEISWSENLERHMKLLEEFSRVSQEIAREVEGPELRYSTELLDLAPADTVIYVGIPNVSSTLSHAYDLLQQKVQQNELLREWWDEKVVGSGTDLAIEQAMERIRGYGDHLGEEIVVTLQARAGEVVDEPIIVARLNHPGDFRAFVEQDLEKLAVEEGHVPSIRVIEGDLPVIGTDTDPAELTVWIRDGYMIASTGVARLRHFAPSLEPQGRSAFTSGNFHPQLAEVYRDGVEWIVGVDLASLLPFEDGPDTEMLERMGLLDLQHVIGQHKTRDDHGETRVVLTFDQPREGLASWLAAPAPMGSLDFVAPDAKLAAGFVMREPISVVDELLGYLATEDEQFEERLEQFERENGIDIREDVAAALGGEFALSLEEPLLPKPAWKLVIEVYDEQRLQRTLEWAVERLNLVMQDAERQGFELRQQRAGGKTWYELLSLDTGLSAHYLYTDGYMVASASRPLVERALQFRRSGVNLSRSARFTSLLPRDHEVNFSAVVYQDLGELLGRLSEHLGQAGAGLLPEQEVMLEGLGARATPSLTVAYGEESRIVFVNTSEGSLIGSTIGSFLNLDTLLSMQELLGRAAQDYDTRGHEIQEHDVDVRVIEPTTEG